MRALSLTLPVLFLATPAWAQSTGSTSQPAMAADADQSVRVDFRGYIPIDRESARMVQPQVVETRIVYLNRCQGGCTITPGFENSVTNRSSIIDSTAQLSAFAFGDDTWKDVVNCVQETYAAFDVTIVTDDPSPAPHWEAIVAGEPSEAGFPANVGGVAPFDAAECGVIDNAITYSFANIYGGSVPDICWTAAQEIAHAFGLDHEFLCSDPMTYLSDCGSEKSFQDLSVPCGEFEPRECRCGSPKQNSFESLMEVFGPRNPTPPRISVMNPQLGQRVGPGFPIRVVVDEDHALKTVELWINEKKVQELRRPAPGPLTFWAPLTLDHGDLTIEVRAADTYGASDLASFRVSLSPECAAATECGDGQTCVEGRCVAGPGTAGGLGATCESDDECDGICAGTSDEQNVCTQACVRNGDGCPSGFACTANKTDGSVAVCWPVPSGGCQSVALSRSAPLANALLLLLAALALARRRFARA